MYFLDFIIIPITILTFIFTSAGIKKRVIGKMLSRQEDSIRMQYRNPLKTCEHVDIERVYSALMFITTFGIFIKAVLRLNNGNDWYAFGMYIMLAALVFCLSDTIVFLIRMTAGCIQGAVLFDEKEERFYVFPSITSNHNRYKEYHASNLFYLIENYSIDSYEKGTAYVFFTHDDRNYAFKVNGKNQINIDALISQQAPLDMSIPFKYRFHTQIPACIALIIALLVGILIFFVC